MSEDLYGDTDAPEAPKPPPPKRKRKSTPKKKIDGHHLRVGVMGYSVDIVSPIPRDQFMEEMVDTINAIENYYRVQLGCAEHTMGWKQAHV